MKKKILSVMTAIAFIASAMPVFAMTMTEVTEIVKGKANIPTEYTEFDISHRSDNEENKSYTMTWTNEEKDEIYVTCDGEGHILRYYKYVETDYDAFVMDSRDEVVNKIIGQAKQLLPECFTDTDTYKKESDVFGKNGSGSVELVRYKDDIRVWGNEIYIEFANNGEGYEITHLMSNHDYKATFGENTSGENPEEKYLALANPELQYNIASVKKSSDKREMLPVLRYAIEKAPFMNPETGEAVEYISHGMDEMGAYAVSGGGSNLKQETAADAMLSREELMEIETMEGLKTAEEIKAELDKLPELDITEDMQIASKSTYKNDNGYFMLLTLSNKEKGDKLKYLSVTADAENGKLINISNSVLFYKNEDIKTEMTEEELDKLPLTGKTFMEKYAREFTDFELTQRTGIKSENEAIITEGYTKIINGIPFTNCTAYIEYNTETNKIYNMSVELPNHEYDGKFTEPSKAVSKEEAFNTILDVYPLTPVFIIMVKNIKKHIP